MPIGYRPRELEIVNRIRGLSGGPRPAGPSNVMPFGGPRLPEVNQGAPMQGNPLLAGNFPTTSGPGTSSVYGNSMGQPGFGPMPPRRPYPSSTPATSPPTQSGAGLIPGGRGVGTAGPQPKQAEYSPRFAQMLQNTANMTDEDRAGYMAAQRDALMERLARYDFAKNRGLVLDETAQADYDNIVKMMTEINRYNAKSDEMQTTINTRPWEKRPDFGPMISGAGGQMPVSAMSDPGIRAKWEVWNMPRMRKTRMEEEEAEKMRMLDELEQYKTGGYGGF